MLGYNNAKLFSQALVPKLVAETGVELLYHTLSPASYTVFPLSSILQIRIFTGLEPLLLKIVVVILFFPPVVLI